MPAMFAPSTKEVRNIMQATANTIRPCGEDDIPAMLAIVNTAAQAYRGVIPADRWHDPYMSPEELASDMAQGVVFSACVAAGHPVGIMGVQRVRNVRLIRHAYVQPAWQGHGVGSRLLDHLCRQDEGPVLIGTWRAATWAIAFYRGHGFEPVPDAAIVPLLSTYWRIPARQIETSLVLARPTLSEAEAQALLQAGSGLP